MKLYQLIVFSFLSLCIAGEALADNHSKRSAGLKKLIELCQGDKECKGLMTIEKKPNGQSKVKLNIRGGGATDNCSIKWEDQMVCCDIDIVTPHPDEICM